MIGEVIAELLAYVGRFEKMEFAFGREPILAGLQGWPSRSETTMAVWRQWFVERQEQNKLGREVNTDCQSTMH